MKDGFQYQITTLYENFCTSDYSKLQLGKVLQFCNSFAVWMENIKTPDGNATLENLKLDKEENHFF